MGALRHAIVDAVCLSLAVSDRGVANGFAKASGNLIELFIGAGCDPVQVLRATAEAIDIDVVTERLLQRRPPPWPEGVDVSACLAQGIVAMSRLKSGGWCFAYLNPEDAADHEVVGASLNLPKHRPVLALRAQLLPFMQAADPFAATPTQVLPCLPAKPQVQKRPGSPVTPEVEQVDEVGSDEDDTFNPSVVDGAPIAATDQLINDPLNSATLHDIDNDNDNDFFVDATERLSQPTGLVRPPSKRPPPPPLPAADTQTTRTVSAPKPPSSATGSMSAPKPPKPTWAKASAAAPVPAWNAPPPQLLEFPREAALVTLAVLLVVLGVMVARRFEVFDNSVNVGDEIVVTTDGDVNVAPAQRILVQQAQDRALPLEQRLTMLSKAVAFDPLSADGLRAVYARAHVFVAADRKSAAARDLETLKRGLLLHPEVAAAADVTSLHNSILSMRDPPATAP